MLLFVSDLGSLTFPEYGSATRLNARFDEGVASTQTIQRVTERRVWSWQIEKSYDSNRPTAVKSAINQKVGYRRATEVASMLAPPHRIH
jgi:hypothetical protein